MSNSSAWQHFSITLKSNECDAFILEFLKTFPEQCYFDRQHHAENQTLHLHIRANNEATLQRIQQYKQTHSLESLEDFDTTQELAELFHGELAETLFQQFSLASMPFIQDALQDMQTESSLPDTAFHIMTLYVLNPECRAIFLSNKNPQAVPLSFLSFRSHSDGYLIRMGNEAKNRKKFEALYQKNQQKYLSHVKDIEAKLQRHQLPAHYQKWINLFNTTLQDIQQAFENNKIDFHNDQSGFIGNSFQLSADNFHHKTANMRLFYRYIRNNKRMKKLRLITGMMYLTLHRLGLSYLERNALCYIISRTMEDKYQTSVDHEIKSLNKNVWRYYLMNFLKLNFSA